MVRTRSMLAPFCLSNDDVLDHVLGFLSKETLARVALTNKVLAARVVQRAVSMELWTKDKELFGKVCRLQRSYFMFVHSRRSDIGDDFDIGSYIGSDEDSDEDSDDDVDPTKDQVKTNDQVKTDLVHLLKDHAWPSHLIDGIIAGNNGLLFTGPHSLPVFVVKFDAIQAVATTHLLKACAISMSPTELIQFAKGVTAARAGVRGSLSNKCVNPWANLWRDVVSSSFARKAWTPDLIVQLSRVRPYTSTSASELVVANLLRIISPDIQSLGAIVREESICVVIRALLLSQYVHRRHFELLMGEADEVTYDEDHHEQLWLEHYEEDINGQQGMQIKDTARIYLSVLERIKPALSVVVQVIRMMADEDRDRHDCLDDDGNSVGGYKRFIGAQLLVNSCFGTGFDFSALSADARKALLEGLATFKQPEIRHKLLEFALGWIHQVVQPLNASSKDAKAIAADVQRICTLLAG